MLDIHETKTSKGFPKIIRIRIKETIHEKVPEQCRNVHCIFKTTEHELTEAFESLYKLDINSQIVYVNKQ